MHATTKTVISRKWMLTYMIISESTHARRHWTTISLTLSLIKEISYINWRNVLRFEAFLAR